MKRSIVNSIVLLMLTACTVTKGSVNNALVVGSIRGPLYLPHSSAISSGGVGLQADLPFNSSSQAEWSRDHRWIALATDNPNKSEIVIIDLAKNLQIQLTDYHNGESFTPTWSPDRNKIAYFSYDAKGDQDGIYVANVSCLFEDPKCNPIPKFLVGGFSPSWSPDGQRIAFESLYHQIAILQVDQVADFITIIPDKTCYDPKWSPTEEKIVVSCFEDNNLDVFSVNVDGSDFTNLTKGDGTNTKPIWSPDGQRIAFVSDRDTTQMLAFDDTVKSNSVYIMDSDGSNVKRITIRNDENIRWLTWVYP